MKQDDDVILLLRKFNSTLNLDVPKEGANEVKNLRQSLERGTHEVADGKIRIAETKNRARLREMIKNI